MIRSRLSAVWGFAQGSVFMRWLVVPLLALATLAFLMGLAILPPDVVGLVVMYYVFVAGSAMVVGLTLEWLVRRYLASREESRAYY